VVERYVHDAHGRTFALNSGGCRRTDIDCDGLVGATDLVLVRNAFAIPAPSGAREDLCGPGPGNDTPDGIIDDADLACVRADLGLGVSGLYNDAPPAPPTDGYPRPLRTFSLHGLTYDRATGLVFARARYYHPELGRWTRRDPKGYVDGGNLYEAFRSNHARYVDPMGTQGWPSNAGFFGATADQVREAHRQAGWAAGAARYAHHPHMPTKEQVERYWAHRSEDYSPTLIQLAKRSAAGIFVTNTDDLHEEDFNVVLIGELYHTLRGTQLVDAAFTPSGTSRLQATDPQLAIALTSESQFELSVLGPLQGGANAIQGVQDIAVDTINLGVDLSIATSPMRPVLSQLDLTLESKQWARGIALETSEPIYQASKFTGGQVILFLAGEGFVGIISKSRAANAERMLNLGSGRNPMPGAVNVDRLALEGVDIVADARALPFRAGQFDEVAAINPAGASGEFFNPLVGDVARVLVPGGRVYVVAQRSNYAFRRLARMDDTALRALGFARGGAVAAPEARFIFGQATTISGETLFMGKARQLTFVRLR
jgi:RHS repeat-associated protein